MTIKFVCSCGKRLRARDEMAARRSACPRCGAPVGIPSSGPTHMGAPVGPMTPAERLRTRRVIPAANEPAAEPVPPVVARRPAAAAPAGPFPHPLDRKLVRQVTAPPRRSGWQPETRWFHCLLYPFRAWLIVVGLAFILTALMIGASLTWPVLVEAYTAPRGQVVLVVGALFSVFPVVVLSYVCGFLDCVFLAGMMGEVRVVRWPGRDLGFAIKSGFTWFVCFLAGPVLPAAAAGAFWYRCGDPALVDWFILAELGVLAVGYWLLAVLAVNQHDRLRDINPLRVAETAERLGWRVLLTILVASVLALAHALGAVIALQEVHREFPLGVLLLLACWISGLYWATFLLRLLSICCRGARVVA